MRADAAIADVMAAMTKSGWDKLRRLHTRSVVIRNWLKMEQANGRILEVLSRAATLQQTLMSGSYQHHGKYLHKLRVGTRAATAVAASEARLKAAATVVTAEAATNIAHGTVITVVASEQEAAELELWQQGDVSLYTPEQLNSRMRLRRDRRVAAALQMWWETAQRDYDDGSPEAGTITFEGYARMHLRLYRVVLKSFSPDDATRCIHLDWQADTKGKGTLTRVAFYDSLFEVCA